MSETQDKLNWLAFRYIANELDAAEAIEFESLLTTEQAAREAVADAVEQANQIRQALAGVVVTAASQRSVWRSARVVIVAVGSCLTLLLALCLVRSSLPITGGVARPAIEHDLSVSRSQLAYAWAEARYGSGESQPAADMVLIDSLDTVLIAAVDWESEQSLAAPSWMLAALAKMDGRIDSEIELQE